MRMTGASLARQRLRRPYCYSEIHMWACKAMCEAHASCCVLSVLSAVPRCMYALIDHVQAYELCVTDMRLVPVPSCTLHVALEMTRENITVVSIDRDRGGNSDAVARVYSSTF